MIYIRGSSGHHLGQVPRQKSASFKSTFGCSGFVQWDCESLHGRGFHSLWAPPQYLATHATNIFFSLALKIIPLAADCINRLFFFCCSCLGKKKKVSAMLSLITHQTIEDSNKSLLLSPIPCGHHSSPAISLTLGWIKVFFIWLYCLVTMCQRCKIKAVITLLLPFLINLMARLFRTFLSYLPSCIQWSEIALLA